MKKKKKIIKIKKDKPEKDIKVKIDLSKLKEGEDKISTLLKSYNPLKAASKFNVKYWKNFFMEKFWPHKTVLVNMELINGFHKMFLVKENDGGFNYDNKKYIFDSESKYYIIDGKIWCYDFHENLDIPIKRIIPLTDIKKALEHSQLTEVEYATNPATLERFIVARIAEGIMKGQQLDEVMKKLMIICIITMVSSLMMLLLFLIKSGMLKSIKIPGVM